jgi:hypothetical protein
MRALVLAFVTFMVGQPLGSYSGNWTADFHGTIYVRLALRDTGGGPQGEISIGNSIHVDKQGNIDQAAEASSTLAPISDARRNGDVVSFSYDTGGDVDKFELRFIDTNTAELRLMLSEEERKELAADGVPLPKPFRLVKSR